MKLSSEIPGYLYALFHDGNRMSGTYGKFFFTRSDARKWKVKASKNNKWSGQVKIGRLRVDTDWQFTR